jgi:hypothetical protein
MNVCKKLCNDCPFSNKSAKGWLAEYSIDDIQQLQNQDALFPCHLMMTDGDMTQGEVNEAIINGEMKLCRGYVESLIKSCKMPRTNKLLIEARALVKAEGVSEESMSMYEFKNYHNI